MLSVYMGIKPHVRQGGCKRARSVDALSLRITACRRAAFATVPAVHHLLTLAAPAHLSHIIISYGPRNKGSGFDSRILQLGYCNSYTTAEARCSHAAPARKEALARRPRV